MELVNITTNDDGSQAVSARELYIRLGYNITAWRRWSTQNIEKNKFAIEHVDFEGLDTMSNGNQTRDYVLTLDFAKRLAQLARTERGEEVRRYFIACEKKAKEAVKPMSAIDMIIQSALEIKRQDERTSLLETKVLQLEARTTTRPDYCTVIGYAVMHGLTVGLQMAARIGAKAKSLCKTKGLMVESIPDPRFGRVGMYPSFILEEVFNSVLV